MVAGTTLIGFVTIGTSLSPTPLTLEALVLVMGIGWAFWQIARLAYVAAAAPLEQGIRGRLGETISTHQGIYLRAGSPHRLPRRPETGASGLPAALG